MGNSFSLLTIVHILRMATPGQTAAQHMSQRHQQMQAQLQPQHPDPSVLSAQAALNIEDTPPIRIVQIAALVPPQHLSTASFKTSSRFLR